MVHNFMRGVKEELTAKPSGIALLRVVIATSLLFFGLGVAGQDETSDESTSSLDASLKRDQVDVIRSRLKGFEADDAVMLSNELIEEIEANHSRVDESLIVPLTLLGDGQRQLGNFVEALEAYDRARYVSRLVNGLHSIDQVDVLYREAETYYELGQIGRAGQRHEYAFSIFLRSFEEDSVELLPGVFALAEWYIETRNIFAARGLYQNAVDISKTHLERTDPRNIRALEGLASTYRLERFTPPAEYEVPQQDLLASMLPEASSFRYVAKLNDFAKGEEALKELVKIELEREGSTVESIAYAKLALADWFLLFQKHQRAGVIYRDIWAMFASNPNASFVRQEFVAPKALYYPLGRNPGLQASSLLQNPIEGTVEFSFDVTDEGEVTNIEVVTIEPDGRYQDEFMDWMERARFRPIINEGMPMPRQGLTLTHHYMFYPDASRD